MKISGYTILEQLYVSKSIHVYRARQQDISKQVIIKINSEEIPDKKSIERLEHEYELAKKFNSLYAARYLGLEKHGHRLAIVMEDDQSITLESFLKKQDCVYFPLLLNIAVQLVEGLKDMHTQGIIHKDINPGNILIHPENFNVKYIDFSIATKQDDEKLIMPNTIKGTLAYISPEQTGRINRAVDTRSDLYSLGVTLYEMFCKTVPFTGSEPLEIIYAHLARLPKPPHEINSEIPIIISNIIMKLLAKNAEDRYQSSYGLCLDLKNCYEQFLSTGQVMDFVIAQHDLSDRFQIPQKLYGREKDVQTLVQAFDSVSTAQTNVLFVAVQGYSGIGKTSLIDELHKPLTREKGYFISGKFDQYNRGIPYATFAQAFKQLIRTILMESEERIAYWKQRIKLAVGANGRLLIDFVPDLELLIGQQPRLGEMSAAEAQSRFNYVLKEFISVFADRSHPLIIFFDDLQWADALTLNLIKLLVDNPESKFLLFIGAYRDNEVDESHPLSHILSDISNKDKSKLLEIIVKPLSFEDINELLCDAFHQPKINTEPLAELIHKKTQGNPFFINQLLLELYQAKLFVFDSDKGVWCWDKSSIDKFAISDNVIDLMTYKIKKQPIEVQQILSIAACMGHHFDLSLLSLVANMPEVETIKIITTAIGQGFLTFKEDDVTGEGSSSSFAFTHDRIQQAAASLLSKKKQKPLKLEIGRLLLKTQQKEKFDENLFYILGNFNSAIKLIALQEERITISKLNLLAAKKAKEATAYSAAVEFCRYGLAFLPPIYWVDYYMLGFELNKLLAECLYLTDKHEEALSLYPILFKAAKNNIDKAGVLFIKMNQVELQAKYNEAIEIMREGLALFGIEFPTEEKALQAMLTHELNLVPTLLKNRSVSSLIYAPEMKDIKHITIMNLLIGLWSPCYVTGQQTLTALVSAKMTNYSLQYGNCELSSIAYVNYSFYAGLLTGNFQQAHEFGKVGIALSQRYNNLSVRCKCYFIFGCGTNVWTQPIRSSFDYYDQCFALGRESGNLPYAGYVAHYAIVDRFIAGMPLPEISKYTKHYYDFLNRTSKPIFDFTRAAIQPLFFLVDKSEVVDENILMQLYPPKTIFMAAYYYGKLICDYFAENIKDSILADKVFDLLPIVCKGTLKVADGIFFAGLTYISLYRQQEDQNLLTKAHQTLVILEDWAKQCKANFAMRYLLLAAEIASCKAESNATDLYLEAITVARNEEVLHVEALSNELFAKFWLRKGQEDFAKPSLKKAYQLYERWGARYKHTLLKEKYQELLSENTHSLIQDGRTTLVSTPQLLDLKTFMKACEAISREVDLESFLSNMLAIILENAGAQQGAFIIAEDNLLFVVAEGTVEKRCVTLKKKIMLDGWQNGSTDVINYVKRTQEKIILDDASHDKAFKDCRYIASTNAKSILCMPLTVQNELKGILYLENRTVAATFTAGRVEMLNLLSNQVAISLENAKFVQKIRDSERRYQMLTDLSPVGIFRTDAQGNNIFTNELWQKSTGLSAEESLGTGWTKAVHPDDVQRVLTEWFSAVKAKSSFATEFRIIQSSNKEVWMLCQARLEINNNNEIEGYVGALTDITERKLYEQARIASAEETAKLQAERAKDAERHQSQLEDFINTICHEIRNPLHGISNHNESIHEDTNIIMRYIDNLSSTTDLAELKNFKYTLREKILAIMASSKNIDTCTNYQEQITNDVLTLSKIASRKIELDCRNFSPKKLVTEIIQVHKVSIEKKKLTLTCHLPKEDITVTGDANRLTSIITNLLSNAIKFTHDGEIIINADVQNISDFHSEFTFMIKDTGIGMDDEEISRLFKPFSQANRRTNAEYGGSGLGLCITKKIIELMDGYITVESKKQQTEHDKHGTTFHFKVKFLRVANNLDYPVEASLPKLTETNIQPTPMDVVTASSTDLPLSILIVEDNAMNVKILENILKKQGNQCHIATNGIEAIDKFKQEKLDLIIMDIEMPIMGGIEATQEIRKLERANNTSSRIPVIGLSGYILPAYKNEAIEAGMDAYLTKPVKRQAILQKIKEVMQETIKRIELSKIAITALSSSLTWKGTSGKKSLSDNVRLKHNIPDNEPTLKTENKRLKLSHEALSEKLALPFSFYSKPSGMKSSSKLPSSSQASNATNVQEELDANKAEEGENKKYKGFGNLS